MIWISVPGPGPSPFGAPPGTRAHEVKLMKAILLAGAMALGGVSLAAAEPVRLTDAQLDQVTAGAVSRAESSCTSGGCTVSARTFHSIAFARARGCFNGTLCRGDVPVTTGAGRAHIPPGPSPSAPQMHGRGQRGRDRPQDRRRGPQGARAWAFRWRKMLDTGVHATLEDLARAKGVNATYVSRILRLTLLAPEIVEAILDGRQPAEMQLDDLLEGFPLQVGGPAVNRAGFAGGGLARIPTLRHAVLPARRCTGLRPRGRDVTDRLEQAAGVAPIDPFEGSDLYGLEAAPRSEPRMTSVLKRPITVSARALS